MSWIIDSSLSWFQRLCINILKTGPVPKHVAFIMDGNRRYATKAKMEKVEGHSKGFDKLTETLRWCLDFGIPEVTVYAFSIENFKRSQEEVDKLMLLAKEKFQQLIDDKEKVTKHGLRIRVIGNLALLSESLQETINEAMLTTKDNSKDFLNIAFAYTSRDEITTSIKKIVEGTESRVIEECDIDEELLSQCLYTSESAEPDLLIRTSGEVRFSDFLLWQIANTPVCFMNVLWPEFSVWNFIRAIFHYQRQHSDIQSLKHAQKLLQTTHPSARCDIRVCRFVENLNNERYDGIKTKAA